MHRTAVKKVVRENVLDANDALAQANRTRFDRAGTYVINMMSSPGAGKTALLERTLERLCTELRLGILEGDVQTTLDADRLARFHIPLVQVNTDPGFGGECHLDANMVHSGLPELPLDEIDLLIIENVGNLVCPAEFKVGEDVRVMVYSITEGEEKPLKYPLMFRSADLVLVNKVDLLEHLDFDMQQFLGHLEAVNPGVRHILTSARTGQGVEEWCAWLQQRLPPRLRE
ncbi:MAG: hydrogenase nickel incorporation protein HypB [Rubrobacter sp.]|nr:hydrogenase nickel incorporation protein HypB [Rubrobacter sp.]